MGSWADLNAWLIPPRAQPEWLRLAALLDEHPDIPCRTSDPDAWWPDRKMRNGPAAQGAVTACLSCLARDACLQYALAAGERERIWGGMLPDERASEALKSAA
ncbi:MAG: hypothetical protein JWP40_985 [Blastococcus sp.]|nr:hypothetical protein [Blastococcus sp.]